MSCLITTTPRTGSWLLADLLYSTGLVGQPQEFFRQDFVRAFSRKLGLSTREITPRYLEGIFGSASPATGVFSAKLQPYDFTRLLGALHTMSPDRVDAPLVEWWLPDPRYVHLARRDRSRQAISWYRALMSNVWWEFRDDSDQRPRGGYPDFLQVRWLENLIGEDEAAWAHYFDRNAIKPLEVAYEDLVTAPTKTVRDVLGYLSIDVPPRFVAVPTRLKQMADSDSEAWLGAYNVLRDSLPPKPDGWYWSIDQGAFVPSHPGSGTDPIPGSLPQPPFPS
jgi:LPS sulfotransferase NodH